MTDSWLSDTRACYDADALGCGPGYVTRHLHDLGVDAFGIDLSPEMIAVARRDHPEFRFEVGTMTDLDLADQSVVGLVAFWSVIHVPDAAVPGVFAEFQRVLRSACPLLVGFHVGDGTRRTREGYSGRPIDVTSHPWRPDTVTRRLRGLLADPDWRSRNAGLLPVQMAEEIPLDHVGRITGQPAGAGRCPGTARGSGSSSTRRTRRAMRRC